MNQSVGETQRRLKNISSYRHHLDGVDQVRTGKDGTSNWKLRLPLGFRAEFALEELAGDDENTVLFRSVGDSKISLMGVISFHEVAPGLTEIELTLSYESSSNFFNVMDRMLSIGDHFVVNQLRRVRAHFEGIAAPAAVRAVPFFHRSLAPV